MSHKCKRRYRLDRDTRIVIVLTVIYIDVMHWTTDCTCQSNDSCSDSRRDTWLLNAASSLFHDRVQAYLFLFNWHLCQCQTTFFLLLTVTSLSIPTSFSQLRHFRDSPRIGSTLLCSIAPWEISRSRCQTLCKFNFTLVTICQKIILPRWLFFH